jgi:hypothetical protein
MLKQDADITSFESDDWEIVERLCSDCKGSGRIEMRVTTEYLPFANDRIPELIFEKLRETNIPNK